MAMLPMKMESKGQRKVVLRGSLLIPPINRLQEVPEPGRKDTGADEDHGGHPRQRHTDLGCRDEVNVLRPGASSSDTARCHHAVGKGTRRSLPLPLLPASV